VFKVTASYFDPTSLHQVRAVDGSTSQSAVVVVRRDSGVTDLAQLRGKTVMFGPRTSSTKWVAARQLFESRGLTVGRDVKVINGGCCEDIAFAVSVRSADAGTVCDHFLGQHSARQRDLGVDARSLSVIGRTPLVPTRVFAARVGVPADVVDRVSRALLALDPARPDHAALLESAEASGFVRTTPAEYLRGVSDPGTGSPP
jgi:phosphonate transport system substrate-binding protein